MFKRLIFHLVICLYLGLHEGHLALMYDGNVMHIFPYKAEIYTDIDTEILKAGIPLDNEKSLSATLEDYFS